MAEREEMVRTLQQKLQAQREYLPPGNARALLVYQNELNRYLALLEEVKAERKAQTAREAPAMRPSSPAPAAKPR